MCLPPLVYRYPKEKPLDMSERLFLGVRSCYNEFQMTIDIGKGKLIVEVEGKDGISKRANWTKSVSQNVKKSKNTLVKLLKSAPNDSSAKRLKIGDSDKET